MDFVVNVMSHLECLSLEKLLTTDSSSLHWSADRQQTETGSFSRQAPVTGNSPTQRAPHKCLLSFVSTARFRKAEYFEEFDQEFDVQTLRQGDIN